MPSVNLNPILRAYIDETGDRGMGPNSSPFFSFACVLVADEHEAPLRATVSRLRQDLSVPSGKALHWKDHVKTFNRREYAADALARLQNVMIVYVLVEKSAIPLASGLRSQQQVFYNYAAGIILERVLLAARDFPGGARDVIMRFGHVRGFNHSTTSDYFDIKVQAREPSWIPWHLLRTPVYFDGQINSDGLQAADQYAGMLSAAIRPNEFGNYQPHHFLKIVHQIRRVNGTALAYGIKILSTKNTVQALPWWSSSGL